MENSFKELQNMADALNTAKAQLGDVNNVIGNVLKDLPKEEREKALKAFDNINIEEVQNMANQSAQNIINHLKNTIK